MERERDGEKTRYRDRGRKEGGEEIGTMKSRHRGKHKTQGRQHCKPASQPLKAEH